MDDATPITIVSKQRLENENLILAARTHFAARNGIAPDDGEVKITNRNQHGNIYTVKYLGKEKTIEGMDEYFSEVFKLIYFI